MSRIFRQKWIDLRQTKILTFDHHYSRIFVFVKNVAKIGQSTTWAMSYGK